jgi:hypothetical protein
MQVRVRTNIRMFRAPCAPKNTGGRHSSMLPHVLSALLDHLLTKPELYLDGMAEFVWDNFEVRVSVGSIRRSLKACNWPKKKNRRVARERDPDLRDACLYELSEYKSSCLSASSSKQLSTVRCNVTFLPMVQ